MTDRDPTIRLAASKARCWAGAGCADQLRCARRMATLPAHGAIVGDYSHNRTIGDPCRWFEPISRRVHQPQPKAKAVKDWPQGVE